MTIDTNTVAEGGSVNQEAALKQGEGSLGPKANEKPTPRFCHLKPMHLRHCDSLAPDSIGTLHGRPVLAWGAPVRANTDARIQSLQDGVFSALEHFQWYLVYSGLFFAAAVYSNFLTRLPELMDAKGGEQKAIDYNSGSS